MVSLGLPKGMSNLYGGLGGWASRGGVTPNSSSPTPSISTTCWPRSSGGKLNYIIILDRSTAANRFIRYAKASGTEFATRMSANSVDMFLAVPTHQFLVMATSFRNERARTLQAFDSSTLMEHVWPAVLEFYHGEHPKLMVIPAVSDSNLAVVSQFLDAFDNIQLGKLH